MTCRISPILSPMLLGVILTSDAELHEEHSSAVVYGARAAGQEPRVPHTHRHRGSRGAVILVYREALGGPGRSRTWTRATRCAGGRPRMQPMALGHKAHHCRPPQRSRPSPICFPRSFPLVWFSAVMRLGPPDAPLAEKPLVSGPALLPEAGPMPPGLCCRGHCVPGGAFLEAGGLGCTMDLHPRWWDGAGSGPQLSVQGGLGRSSPSREGGGNAFTFALRIGGGRGEEGELALTSRVPLPLHAAWTHLSQLLLSRPGSSILGACGRSGVPPRLGVAPFVLWPRGLSQDSSALGTSRRSTDNLGCHEQESEMPLSVPPCTASLASGDTRPTPSAALSGGNPSRPPAVQCAVGGCGRPCPRGRPVGKGDDGVMVCVQEVGGALVGPGQGPCDGPRQGGGWASVPAARRGEGPRERLPF